MMQIVQTLMRFLPHAGTKGAAHGRSERDTSDDRALAAFKVDLAERSGKNTRHIPGEWQSRRSGR